MSSRIPTRDADLEEVCLGGMVSPCVRTVAEKFDAAAMYSQDNSSALWHLFIKEKNFATPDCCGIQNAGQSFESASPCGVLQWVIGCAADFCLPAAKLSCGECRQRGACSIDGRWTDVCTMRDSQHWRPRPGVDTAAHSCRLPTALTRSTVPVASAGGKMSAALVRADIVRASLRTDHARAIELDLTDHHSRIHKR